MRTLIIEQNGIGVTAHIINLIRINVNSVYYHRSKQNKTPITKEREYLAHIHLIRINVNSACHWANHIRFIKQIQEYYVHLIQTDMDSVCY